MTRWSAVAFSPDGTKSLPQATTTRRGCGTRPRASRWQPLKHDESLPPWRSARTAQRSLLLSDATRPGLGRGHGQAARRAASSMTTALMPWRSARTRRRSLLPAATLLGLDQAWPGCGTRQQATCWTSNRLKTRCMPWYSAPMERRLPPWAAYFRVAKAAKARPGCGTWPRQAAGRAA